MSSWYIFGAGTMIVDSGESLASFAIVLVWYFYDFYFKVFC
jgi:hypothetical protein